MEDILREIERLMGNLDDEQRILVGLSILYATSNENKNYFSLKDKDGNLLGVFASDEHAKRVNDFITNINTYEFFNPFKHVL